MSDYWKASIPRSLYDQIKKLFREKPSIGARYSNNPAEFLRDAIRARLETLENNCTNPVNEQVKNTVI